MKILYNIIFYTTCVIYSYKPIYIKYTCVFKHNLCLVISPVSLVTKMNKVERHFIFSSLVLSFLVSLVILTKPKLLIAEWFQGPATIVSSSCLV